MKNIVNKLISGINTVVSKPFEAINSMFQKIHDLNILGVTPFSWLGTIKIPQIPMLAKGGIINTPTVAMLGEYSNARTNPEIAAPQSVIREIVSQGNDDVINVLIQIGRQIISTIEDKDLEVSIGDDVIASSAARGNRSYYNRTGKSLLAI